MKNFAIGLIIGILVTASVFIATHYHIYYTEGGYKLESNSYVHGFSDALDWERNSEITHY